MNALRRFLSPGMQDADRRVAAWLTPPSTRATDQYLWSRALVMGMARLARQLQDWLKASRAQHLWQVVRSEFEHDGWNDRYQSVAMLTLVAVAVHVSMTVAQGPRPGWFWLVIPAMAAVFALLALVGTVRAER